MHNRELFEREMKRNNIAINQMAELLGISRTAFYRKRYGKSEFTQSEIQKSVECLKLKTPVGIFFDGEVS